MTQQIPIPSDPKASLWPRAGQKLSVYQNGHEPMAARVERPAREALIVTMQEELLQEGDEVTLIWEADNNWYSLQTRVSAHRSVDSHMVWEMDKDGALRIFDDRRMGLRRNVSVTAEITVVESHHLSAGTKWEVKSEDISASAIRFATSDALSVGDVLSAKLKLEEQGVINASLQVTRIYSEHPSEMICICHMEFPNKMDRLRVVAYMEDHPDR